MPYNIKTLGNLNTLILEILPNATLGEDNDGQVIIYTDLRLNQGKLEPFEI